jgi:hypothetical protein
MVKLLEWLINKKLSESWALAIVIAVTYIIAIGVIAMIW